MRGLELLFKAGDLLLNLRLVTFAGLERAEQLAQRLVQRRLRFLLRLQVSARGRLLRGNVLIDLMEHRVFLLRLGQLRFVLANLLAVTSARVAVHFGEQARVAVVGVTFTRLGGAARQRQ